MNGGDRNTARRQAAVALLRRFGGGERPTHLGQRYAYAEQLRASEEALIVRLALGVLHGA